MSTIIDKTLFIIAFLIGGFVIISYITNSYILGLLIVILIFIIYLLTKKYFAKKETTTISKKDYWQRLLLEGKEYVRDALFETFSVFYAVEKIDNSIVIKLNDKNVLIYNAFKFGSLSEEDIATAYRLCNKNDITEIYFFYNNADRKAFALTNAIPQKVKLLSFRSFFKIAMRADKLPNLENPSKKQRKWRLITKSVFSFVNIKLFLFAGISTAILSLLTPLKVYYLVFSAINLVMAVIIAIVTRKEEKILL